MESHSAEVGELRDGKLMAWSAGKCSVNWAVVRVLEGGGGREGGKLK